MPNKVSLLLKRPSEAPDRILNKIHGLALLGSNPCTIADEAKSGDLATALSSLFPDARTTTADYSSIQSHIEAQLMRLAGKAGPFGSFHNGTPTLGQLCYLVCRYLRPHNVVETGVAYGVTSAYISRGSGREWPGPARQHRSASAGVGLGRLHRLLHSPEVP